MNLARDAGSHRPLRDVRGVGRTSPALGRVGWLLARLRQLDQEAHDLVVALAEALELARQDPRNGLPNRRFIQQRLAPAISDPGTGDARIGLVFIELDRPAATDEPRDDHARSRLLQAVAQRIVACTRSGDTMCRCGGDEFLVLLRDVDGDAAIRVAADNLERQLAAPTPSAVGSGGSAPAWWRSSTGRRRNRPDPTRRWSRRSNARTDAGRVDPGRARPGRGSRHGRHPVDQRPRGALPGPACRAVSGTDRRQIQRLRNRASGCPAMSAAGRVR